MNRPPVCKCGKGYGSLYDGLCFKCRGNRTVADCDGDRFRWLVDPTNHNLTGEIARKAYNHRALTNTHPSLDQWRKWVDELKGN